MAVTVLDTGTAAYNASAATQNYTFTVSSGATLAVFFLAQDATQTISSVTWDQGTTNQACTLVGSEPCHTTTNGKVYIYAVVNPTARASGTLRVVQTATGLSAEMQSYTGTVSTSVAAACTNALVAQSTLAGATASTAAQSGVSGDMYIGLYVCPNVISAVSNTSIDATAGILSPAGNDAAYNRAASTGANITLTATVSSGADWAAVSCNIKAGSAATVNDGWYLPFNTPIWRRSLFTPDQQFLANSPGVSFPEVVTESRWHQPWSEPARLRRINPNSDQFFVQTVAVTPTGTVVFDAQSTSDLAVNGSPFSNNTLMTVGTGSNRALVCIIAWDGSNGAPTNVVLTWDGQPFTLISNTSTNNGVNGFVSIYGLLNPNSGTKVFAGSWLSGPFQIYTSLISYTGVNQTSIAAAFPNGTTATGAATPSTINVTSNSNSAVVGVASTGGSFLAVTSGTQVFLDNSQSLVSGVGIRATGAATVTLTATDNSAWAMAATSIAPASATTVNNGWFTAFSDPPSRVLFAPARQSFLSYTEAFPFAETVTESRWHSPWSDPLRAKVQPQSTDGNWVPQQAAATPVSIGWFNTFSDPVRRRLSPTPDWPLIPQQAAATPVSIGWFSALVDPTRRLRTPAPDWSLVPPQPNVTVAYDWPDFIARKPTPLNYTPLAFDPITFQAAPAPVEGYTQWPDFSQRKPSVVYQQPSAFVPVVVTVVAPTMAWTQWPDFARRRPPAPDNPFLAFVPPQPQVTVAYDWPDFIPRRLPLNYVPLGFDPTVILTVPAPIEGYTTWGDFARARPNLDALYPFQNFVAPQPTATELADWPDFARGKPRGVNYTPVSFVPVVQTIPAPTWTQWTSWPDYIQRRPFPLNYPHLSFTAPQPNVTVTEDWVDFFPRKNPLNYEPLAFVQTVTQIVVVPTEGYVQWPDFAYRKPQPLNYPPLAYVQTIITPNTGFVQWPDFVYRKKPPLNFNPLTLTQTVTTPWNAWSQWPDFAPVRGKRGLSAADQQFLSQWPGKITLNPVTGVMAAFEIDTDTAIFAINVTPTHVTPVTTNPPVRAVVSIHEIGRFT